MKKITCMLLAISIVVCMISMAFAASDEAVEAANALYELELFRGTGTNADGTPNFDLDRVPTRFEAVTMLVRLLGKEEEAVSRAWETPFTDVTDWAAPYVGYAYDNGLTTGTSSTTFGGYDAVNATQYITLVLRSLGYKSGTDFLWDKAWELSDKIGMTDGRYNEQTVAFTRGDVAIISYNSLAVKENSGEAANVPVGFTDGYEKAEFQKFNSYASENGLGGTKIYLYGRMDGIEVIGDGKESTVVGTLTDEEGHKWIVHLNLAMMVSDAEYDRIIGKSIVLCGVYEGYSSVRQMPALTMTELCVLDTGDIKSGVGKILYPDDTEVGAEPTEVTLNSAHDIQNYLNQKYSTLTTSAGKTNFTFNVLENTTVYQNYDYNIWTEYDLGFFMDIKSSISLTQEQKENAKAELRAFQKQIADDLIEKLPDKKLEGSYHYSYYKYQYIKEGLTIIRSYEWSNYDYTFTADLMEQYSSSYITSFHWTDDNFMTYTSY